MNKKLIIIFLIYIIIILFLIRVLTFENKVFQFNDNFNNYNDTDKILSPFDELLNCKISKTFYGANIILFSDFSLIDQNINKIPFNRFKNYHVYGLCGSDDMANKMKLAYYLKLSGNTDKIPKTYILEEDSDVLDLKNNHSNNSIYILKKNIQRQEGILITRDISIILEEKSKYVIAQELLQNPFLINKRKINMRVYLLITIKNNKINFYIYNNGFIYYSPKYWETKSIDKDVNITTGYIDRKIYETNPLTHFDLYNNIGIENSSKLQKSIVNLFKNIKLTYEHILLNQNKKSNIFYFNIFGCDIAPSDDLNVKIIEINKGPDLSFKSKRDKEVKYNLVKDCLNLVNNNYNNNYIKL